MKGFRIGKKYEGKCVAVFNGKVVLANNNITKLMRASMKDYPQASILTVPKRSKILVL